MGLGSSVSGTVTVSYTPNTDPTKDLQDAAGNSVAAITNKSVVVDTIAPTLVSSAPADNATDIAVGVNIVLTMSETVKAGTGNIQIVNSSNSSDTRVISVTDTTQVSFSGSAVTINPTADLQTGASYYVSIAPGVITDLVGNAFAGITTNTDLNFGTTGTGGAGQTFVLTTAIDVLPGLIGSLGTTDTSGNDTIVGDNTNAGSLTVNVGDQLNAGPGIDTLKIFSTNIIPTLSNIENAYYFAPAGDLNVSTIAGLTSLEVDSELFAANRTFTLGAGQALKLSNMPTNVAADPVIAGNSQTSLDLSLNKFGTLAYDATASQQDTVDFTGTQLATLNITTTGGASNFQLVNTGGQLKTVTVGGNQALLIDTALGTITTFNATSNSVGVNLNSIAASSLAFTGGTGSDRVNMAATLTVADVLDGGNGTDTFAASDADTVTKAAATNVKNFEVYEATTADATAYDVDAIIANNPLTGILISETGGAGLTVNNINSGAVNNIMFTNDAPAIITLTAKNFVAGGTSDTATVKLDNSIIKSADGVDVTTSLTFANVDVLNVNSIASTPTATAAAITLPGGAVTSANANSIADLAAADLEKIVVTGSETTLITAGVTTVGLTEVDATGLTGKAALGLTATAAPIASILVKGTPNADGIVLVNAATNAVTAYTGGGSDNLELGVTGAAHTLIFTSTAFNSGDFKAGNVIAINANNAFAVGDTVTLDFSSAMEALFKNGGVVLGTSAANVAIAGTALGPNTNVAATQAAGVMTIDFDLNGDGVYNVANDVRITILGTGVDDTLVYNAANDNFVFTVV
ncbi:putative Hemolysin-type calcium-binding region [Candidatus Contendobacter odensis Run_B_J11]|uniref:Hemolysin-type calcium-binding region n=1 Tax=Candidatus Contendobacter odensis Run_B_J11 TaxID=1400861 RepID=A0A7U7GCM7_9GAMM|nr:putative Hemolysin-type calcium-binding region [Candidatus Contendobacter odensis Run_B_J11]